MLKNIVEYIVTALVEKPESVSITLNQRDGNQVMTIQVSDQDKGKVIGKDGKTIRAIRNLIEAVKKDKQFIEIDVQK